MMNSQALAISCQRMPEVKMETMVIVDDNHHWSKHENAIKVLEATAEFLKKQWRFLRRYRIPRR